MLKLICRKRFCKRVPVNKNTKYSEMQLSICSHLPFMMFLFTVNWQNWNDLIEHKIVWDLQFKSIYLNVICRKWLDNIIITNQQNFAGSCLQWMLGFIWYTLGFASSNDSIIDGFLSSNLVPMYEGFKTGMDSVLYIIMHFTLVSCIQIETFLKVLMMCVKLMMPATQ